MLPRGQVSTGEKMAQKDASKGRVKRWLKQSQATPWQQ